MKNKKRVAIGVGLVAVIVYLWLNRYRKKKAITEAKAGADVAGANTAKADTAVAEVAPKIISSSPAEECGGSRNKPTSSNGQVEQTISITQSSANFSGSNGKVINGQYFR